MNKENLNSSFSSSYLLHFLTIFAPQSDCPDRIYMSQPLEDYKIKIVKKKNVLKYINTLIFYDN